jgi:hypothetical protein
MNPPDLTPTRTSRTRTWWARTRARWLRFRATIRGLIGAAAFIAAALEEILTAAAGTPRPSRYLTRAGRLIADEYRLRAANAIDADVIDDQEGTR